jgi:hypothetical protein
MKMMNDKRELFEKILSRKRDKVIQKIADLEEKKENVYLDIDKFFNKIIEKAKARSEQLKKEYGEIEE